MYWVSIGLVCLYILEKVDIWSGDTDASQTDRQTTEYSATQLLSSIQFKLSHAINMGEGDIVMVIPLMIQSMMALQITEM